MTLPVNYLAAGWYRDSTEWERGLIESASAEYSNFMSVSSSWGWIVVLTSASWVEVHQFLRKHNLWRPLASPLTGVLFFRLLDILLLPHHVDPSLFELD